jgi:transglutaminase-like putative cysteine protease
MRLRIAHSIVLRYDPPATGVIQVLRLTPRNHEGQHVIGWRIDVSADARLNAHEDAFGNLTHVFTADGPLEALSIRVDGEVDTQNTEGIVRGSLERFPPSLFLRDTPLTHANSAIREFAQEIRTANSDRVLAGLHALLHRLHNETSCESNHSPAAPTAAEAFARKRGGSRDLAHIFIGAAHSLHIPARYVAGYFCAGSSTVEQESDHAWVEAFVTDLGWVGFDPTNCVCPTDAYVRVAIGLDALGAAPVRGTRLGTGGERSAVAIKVDQ